MTDTALLKKIIQRNGYKLKFIAEKLNITYYGLLKKMNNETEFKASEIQILFNLLGMTEQERELVFFTLNVE